jgi:hypothetical protein
MATLYFAFFIAVLTAVFALQNTTRVTVRLLFWQYELHSCWLFSARQRWGPYWLPCWPLVLRGDGPGSSGICRQQTWRKRHGP